MSSCCSIETGEGFAGSAFSTPAEAAGAFRDAFRCGRADLEYKCLAEVLKERQGITRQSYGIAREQILEENPGLKWLRLTGPGTAEFSGPDRARVPLECFWIDAVVLDLTLQHYFEALDPAGVMVLDGFLSGEQARRLTAAGGQGLAVLVDIEPAAAGYQISSVRIGREWKVAGIGDGTPAL